MWALPTVRTALVAQLLSTIDKKGAWIQGGGAKAWLNDLPVIAGMQSILICVQRNAPVVMHLQEFTFTDIVTDSAGPSSCAIASANVSAERLSSQLLRDPTMFR